MVGETTTLLPVRAPGIQEYVAAPDAVSVTLPETQMEVGVGEAVMVGVGFTTRATVAGDEQEPLLPVTV